MSAFKTNTRGKLLVPQPAIAGSNFGSIQIMVRNKKTQFLSVPGAPMLNGAHVVRWGVKGAATDGFARAIAGEMGLHGDFALPYLDRIVNRMNHSDLLAEHWELDLEGDHFFIGGPNGLKLYAFGVKDAIERDFGVTLQPTESTQGVSF